MPRTHEEVHRDISLANQYRLEFIKHTMSLAAGVFVFTVTFRKEIVTTPPGGAAWALSLGWLAMILSLVGGLGHLAGWDRFYISYRDYNYDAKTGRKVRKHITWWRRFAMGAQVGGFVAGLAFIAIYCAVNL